MSSEYSDLGLAATAAGCEIPDRAVHARVGGVHVLAAVDEVELERRRRHGPFETLDWRQLEALSALPHDVPVAWDDIELGTTLVLDTLPVGVVSRDGTSVRRAWRPAVTPAAALAVVGAASSWRRALDRVAVHAAAAPRVLVVPRLPSSVAPLVERASRLGVAVVEARPAPSVVVRVDPRRHVRPGPVQWELAEQVWEACGGGAIRRRPSRREPTREAARP